MDYGQPDTYAFERKFFSWVSVAQFFYTLAIWHSVFQYKNIFSLIIIIHLLFQVLAFISIQSWNRPFSNDLIHLEKQKIWLMIQPYTGIIMISTSFYQWIASILLVIQKGMHDVKDCVFVFVMSGSFLILWVYFYRRIQETIYTFEGGCFDPESMAQIIQLESEEESKKIDVEITKSLFGIQYKQRDRVFPEGYLPPPILQRYYSMQIRYRRFSRQNKINNLSQENENSQNSTKNNKAQEMKFQQQRASQQPEHNLYGSEVDDEFQRRLQNIQRPDLYGQEADYGDEEAYDDEEHAVPNSKYNNKIIQKIKDQKKLEKLRKLQRQEEELKAEQEESRQILIAIEASKQDMLSYDQKQIITSMLTDKNDQTYNHGGYGSVIELAQGRNDIKRDNFLEQHTVGLGEAGQGANLEPRTFINQNLDQDLGEQTYPGKEENGNFSDDENDDGEYYDQEIDADEVGQEPEIQNEQVDTASQEQAGNFKENTNDENNQNPDEAFESQPPKEIKVSEEIKSENEQNQEESSNENEEKEY